jgi:hypothetical protein
MDSLPQRREVSLIICLFLCMLILAVFWQVQNHDFILLDDYDYIVENPHVNSGLSIENIKWSFTTYHASYWHPLTWMSHMLDSHLYGLNPKGHHFNSVLLHMFSSLLLFIVLHKMTGALWRSAFVAALFSIHPLRIESVAWAAERKDVLGALFWMTILWTYLRYVRRPRMLNYVLIVFSFSLGLMAKPMLVTLPFVLLLLDFWPLCRFGFGKSKAHGSEEGKRRTSPAVLVLEKLPLFALAAASSIATLFAVHGFGGINPEAIPFDSRAVNTLVSYLEYIRKLVWPSGLAILYPFPTDLPFWQAGISLVVLTAISILVVAYARRYPYLVVGWLWFLGTLVPVIGLFHVGPQALADRFTYVPHVGLLLALTWGAAELASAWRCRKTILSTASGLIILLFSWETTHHLGYWRDSITLFSRAVQITETNFMARHLLGTALASQGRLAEAAIHFSESVKIKPVYVPALFNLASTLSAQGKLEEAAAIYSRALQVAPYDAASHNNLGNVLVKLGKTEEGVLHYQEALRIKPDLTEARINLDLTLRRLSHHLGTD